MDKNEDKRTEKRRLGDIGEGLACEFLRRKGFEILDRNYLRKWGELDIVAKKGSRIHFIEVKSISVPSLNVPHETDRYRPEDNMHAWKIQRIHRAMQGYLLDKDLDNEFQLDLVTVKIDQNDRKGRVEMLENIII